MNSKNIAWDHFTPNCAFKFDTIVIYYINNKKLVFSANQYHNKFRNDIFIHSYYDLEYLGLHVRTKLHYNIGAKKCPVLYFKLKN